MAFTFQRLAVPGALLNLSFLAFSSQYLFRHLEPGNLSQRELVVFNLLVACLFISYYRASSTHPGKLTPGMVEQLTDGEKANNAAQNIKGRWCRKCQQIKPPRWHHCSKCACVPKMDHHCIWISNCVSATTFPIFIRYLLYSVLASAQLEYFLFVRFKFLWDSRRLPSYLGPSTAQLIHLLLLAFVNSMSLLSITTLFANCCYGLASNTTTIEGWEMDRHRALLKRARTMGGFVYGPGGVKIWLTKQEFPYDVGIWKNIKQGMGTGNVLAWVWPFSSSPPVEDSLEFEINDFNDSSTSWPPPDPDRLASFKVEKASDQEVRHVPDFQNHTELDAFRQRQADDISRHQTDFKTPYRRRPFHERFEDGREYDDGPVFGPGEESWRNSEGERLKDFGVDEDVEFYDEDDVPLSVLIERRKGK